MSMEDDVSFEWALGQPGEDTTYPHSVWFNFLQAGSEVFLEV